MALFPRSSRTALVCFEFSILTFLQNTLKIILQFIRQCQFKQMNSLKN
jgi:hypothetical protein